MGEYHTPVLTAEVMEYLDVRPGRLYIDATVGGGGHTANILRQGGKVLGIDTDREAIDASSSYLGSEFTKKDWVLVHGNFRNIASIARAHGFAQVSGILFDLGVSSHQLDTDRRGFSFRYDTAPLDLRLNQDSPIRAADIVNSASREELYEIFASFGEEERADAISSAIIRARTIKKIETIRDIREAVDTVVHGEEKTRTMARVLQALRIKVNDELGALKDGLKNAGELLGPEGRLAVISFHSLEDRIVKQYMRKSGLIVITKKPVTATEKEVYENSRARSAKLRVLQNL